MNELTAKINQEQLQEAIDKAAEEVAVAHSPGYAGDYSGEVLLGKVPWHTKK
jgi:hypothetical protein